MSARQIFIRHGQIEHERENGLKLAKLIDSTPAFRAFFAEAVQDTDGSSQHIFTNLERSDGFLAVMHKRGEVEFLGKRFTRASVWIQQELAIVSMLNHQREAARRIKVRVLAQRGIKREGLADVLILNPTEFDRDEELPELVRAWLTGPTFVGDPVATAAEKVFRAVSEKFDADHWRYLTAVLIITNRTPGEVDRGQVLAMVNRLGGLAGPVDSIEGLLVSAGLLFKGVVNRDSGITPVHVASGFIDLIQGELRRRGRM